MVRGYFFMQIFRRILNKMKYRNVIGRKVNNYKKRNILRLSKRKRINVKLKSVMFFFVVVGVFLYIHFSEYSLKSIYVGIFMFLLLIFYLLVVDRMREGKKMNVELEEIKKRQVREEKNFLEKIREIERLEKSQIKEIILKNEDGYDIQRWEIGRKTALLIGKETGRNRVDIDVSKENFSNLVSRMHGSLNRVNGVWYYEDLGSQNGSGIEKRDDKRKVRIGRNEPIRVESGDIIYLPITKLLLK